MSPQFFFEGACAGGGRNEEEGDGVGDETRYPRAPFLHTVTFFFLVRALTWGTLTLTWDCDSMICDKQFVPFDDQSLYCSEE